MPNSFMFSTTIHVDVDLVGYGLLEMSGSGGVRAPSEVAQHLRTVHLTVFAMSAGHGTLFVVKRPLQYISTLIGSGGSGG
jgi:hypothetical protein